MNSPAPVILLFTRDLRLGDQPALTAACDSGAPVIAVFVLDEESAGDWRAGAAARWWLHHSLAALGESIAQRGSRLILRRGPTAATVAALARETGAETVFAGRRPEPWLDRAYAALEQRYQLRVRLSDTATLFPPGTIRTKTGGVYKVFSQFWRAALEAASPPLPVPGPDRIPAPGRWPDSEPLAALALLPRPDWAGGLRAAWQPGETGAEARLDAFLADGLAAYRARRDRPAEAGSSRLSPHLAMGEISPYRVWHAALAASGEEEPASGTAAAFLRELGWREFAYHLLHAHPDLPDAPLRAAFAAFPWREDATGLAAWQRGRTGFPIVDAGMRELWVTGWMHNRVRMIAASFLVKDLRLPWQEGERWFWDTLVDADLANNALGWQWVAGCGPDAAPYFRIFNPVRQSERYDPEGSYIRRWVPELAGLDRGAIHAPWRADAAALRRAGVGLGEDYPRPILDHAAARQAALAAFAQVKAQA